MVRNVDLDHDRRRQFQFPDKRSQMVGLGARARIAIQDLVVTAFLTFLDQVQAQATQATPSNGDN